MANKLKSKFSTNLQISQFPTTVRFTEEWRLTWDPVSGHLGGEGEEPAHEGQLGRVGGGHMPQPVGQVLVVALLSIAPAVEIVGGV